MYGIIKTGGFQYKIEKDIRIKVPYIDAEIGSEIALDKVLFISGENGTKIGSPFIENAKAQAEILKHGLYDKIIIFKKRRRHKFRKKQGHRQRYTEIKVKDIILEA